MILPISIKTLKKTRRGQILIIFLLILVVGMAIVLSVASRTLTDIRTSTTTDESNRAYFAAEAGVEEALRQIEDCNPCPNIDLDFSNINTKARASIREGNASGVENFVFPDKVEKDDVVQVSLVENFAAEIPAAHPGLPDNYYFYWGAAGDNTALDIAFVYYCSGGCSAYGPFSGNFGVTRVAFDPTPDPGTNLCSTINGGTYTPASPGAEFELTDGLTGNTYKLGHKLSFNPLTMNTCNVSTPLDPIPAGTVPVMMRIRPLYNANSVFIGVGVEELTGDSLPSQGAVIESEGKTASGVTRRLQVVRLHPALPSLFDYVLFNGSNNPIVK